jgi:Uma2 family endonuclease
VIARKRLPDCGTQAAAEVSVAGATILGMRAPSPNVESNEPAEALSRQRSAQEPQPPRGEWWSHEPEMENVRHLMQMLALIATLRWHWRGRSDYFVGGNLSVYFSEQRLKNQDFRGPDFFVVLGVDGARERRSWVVWEEGGKYPNVIIELLSDSTAENDRGVKKQVYQDVFRTPEYYLFDPERGGLEGFQLVAGRYQRMTPDAEGRLVCDQLELLLGVRDGELRFYERDGKLVLKPEEEAEALAARVEQERQHAEHAEQERTRAEQDRLRAEAEIAALREKLRQHGIDDEG